MEEGGCDLNKIDLEEMKESKATFVFGQMNEPPGARARVALSGLTIAEYFRDGDGEGQGKTSFFVDNIFRFTQAGSEVSALLGRMPSCWIPTYWLQRWGQCRNELHQQRVGRLHLFRQYTYLRMTQTRLQQHICSP